MQLRILGCSGAEFPGHLPSAFLVDGSLLLDAGTVGAVLGEEEQLKIKDILVTHAHLDHIGGIPLLADNLVVGGRGGHIFVHGVADSLRALQEHVLNGIIWPDFSAIPPENPALRYRTVVPEDDFSIGDYQVAAFRVNHSIAAVGYRIRRGDKTLLYTGDTGPTERIWEEAGRVDALLVEVSFPSAMEELALLTGHLTPRLLKRELEKIAAPPKRILITHLKEQHGEVLRAELAALAIPELEVVRDGDIYEL